MQPLNDRAEGDQMEDVASHRPLVEREESGCLDDRWPWSYAGHTQWIGRRFPAVGMIRRAVSKAVHIADPSAVPVGSPSGEPRGQPEISLVRRVYPSRRRQTAGLPWRIQPSVWVLEVSRGFDHGRSRG